MRFKTLLFLCGCFGIFTFAEARHHDDGRGVRLATDIVNLVGASLNLLNPRPVVVAPAPVVYGGRSVIVYDNPYRYNNVYYHGYRNGLRHSYRYNNCYDYYPRHHGYHHHRQHHHGWHGPHHHRGGHGRCW